MTKNITVELDEKYSEHLELLKQIIPDSDWSQITENWKMVEVLIDSFLSFLQEQAAHHAHDHDGGCCWGGSCGTEDKWHGGCGCH